ncbi:MAG: peptidoglycan-binding domain-containing protein [Candidatus Paceibacterota bacterium]|jgi:hypothetical protein
MIKKIKFLFIIILTLFIEVNIVYAANNYSVDTNVFISSLNINLVIVAGSSDDGMIVNTDNIIPTISSGETFTVNNASGGLSVSPNNSNVVIGCDSNQMASVIVTGASSQAYTITPSSTLCVLPVSIRNSGRPPIIPATSTPKIITKTPNPSTILDNPKQTAHNFGTTTLRNGSRGESVKELQRFLNKVLKLNLVVDGKLGPKTVVVIKKWQKTNGLTPDGLVGEKTKEKMNALN